MAVTGHYDGDVVSILDGRFIAADDCCADAAVLFLFDQHDACVPLGAATDDLRSAVLRAVIDDIHRIDDRRHRFENLEDFLLFVVGRHDDGNALFFNHNIFLDHDSRTSVTPVDLPMTDRSWP